MLYKGREIEEFHRVKELAIAIKELSCETGYDEEYLSDQLEILADRHQSYNIGFAELAERARRKNRRNVFCLL